MAEVQDGKQVQGRLDFEAVSSVAQTQQSGCPDACFLFVQASAVMLASSKPKQKAYAACCSAKNLSY